MFKFIIPVILITVAVALFFVFTSPLYNDITSLKEQVASYNEALDNSKALENERDKLTKKYNAITPENLEKLSKLLPNNVDNIRLILEIEKVAAPYGMVLKDVKYSPSQDTDKQKNGQPGGIPQQGVPDTTPTGYGTWDLEFSTQGTYTNFVNFVKDLESNLRIVDVAFIEFSSPVSISEGTNPVSLDIYKYSFKIKTYWLKN